MIVWIVGPSGVGKTTVGRLVHAAWREARPGVVWLDGDELRAADRAAGIASDYSVAGRKAAAARTAVWCGMLAAQGLDVIVTTLGTDTARLLANREEFDDYIEVALRAPLEELERRDPKGHYADARRKLAGGEAANFVGLDQPATTPIAPDLGFDTRTVTAEEIAAAVLRFAGIAADARAGAR